MQSRCIKFKILDRQGVNSNDLFLLASELFG